MGKNDTECVIFIASAIKNIPILSMYLQAELTTVYIEISCLLRSQLILFYTVLQKFTGYIKS